MALADSQPHPGLPQSSIALTMGAVGMGGVMPRKEKKSGRMETRGRPLGVWWARKSADNRNELNGLMSGTPTYLQFG